MTTAPIVCASPSCAARLVVPVDVIEAESPTPFFRFLASRSWAMQRQPGDENPRPYCGRCKE